MLYSIKMRASKIHNKENKHISGAEKIVFENEIYNISHQLLKRSMEHSKGKPDFINIKIENIAKEDIIYLDALKVTTIKTRDHFHGKEKILELLRELNICNGEKILEIMKKAYGLRGAIIIDTNTLERLEPNSDRGVRVTNMDSDFKSDNKYDNKNHYREAIVLATKVTNAPGIIAEICISDDPDYVAGYVASKQIGYVRITNIKELGSENGGRIFLYNGKKEDLSKTIEFLEKQLVIVNNIEELNKSTPTDKWMHIIKELNLLKDNNLYRELKKINSPQSSTIYMNNEKYLMLASNDYLDLANNPEIKSYAKEIIDKYGVGSGGSRLTTGNFDIHELLEERIAKFKDTEKALLFNNGYLANFSTIASICGSEDVILSDESNHASIIDGCKLSGSKVVIYRHNDMNDLEEKAKLYRGKNGIIVSDAVFSMTGDICKLPQLMEIAEKYNYLSMIDEAHSIGVLGKTGRGIVEHYNLHKKPDIIMGTLSKAMGSEGGFIAGKKELIEYLKNKGRSFIFTTSLSPATIGASIKALEIIEKSPELVSNLQNNIKYFGEFSEKNGIQSKSESAIIPIFIGDEKKALEIGQKLFEKKYFISPIRYPTVKHGEAILRIALMSSHTKEELMRAATDISKILMNKI